MRPLMISAQEYTEDKLVSALPWDNRWVSTWGTGIYIHDSSILTAVVCSGLLTYEKGGDVVIEIVDPSDYYEPIEFPLDYVLLDSLP